MSMTVVSEFMMRDLTGQRIDVVGCDYGQARIVDVIVGDERIVLGVDGVEDLIRALEASR